MKSIIIIKIAYSFSGTAHALCNGGRDTFAGEELTATVQRFDWDKHATVYWKKSVDLLPLLHICGLLKFHYT